MREHSVGTSLGLAAGDRVLRVDGEPVVDGADVVDLHQRLASASRVALDIATPTGERRLVWSLTGRPLDLVLTTDDVRFAVRDEEAVAAVATLPEGVAPAAILDAVGEAPPPRLEPHVDLLGHPDGVRVMGLRPRAPLFALGLRNGDVIHAIAGAPVGEQDAALIAALSSGREFELRLSRGGDEPLTLRLTGSASRPPAPSP
jgi:S1-C subfamily serine protease